MPPYGKTSGMPGELPGTVTERLKELLQRLMQIKNVKHAVVAVERGDGSFRWFGATGMANPDGTPMREDTPFWIASVTKLYIATAILKLHEQGRLSIYDPMAKYLPQSMIGGLHRTRAGVDQTGKITLRHLLGHASGLPDYSKIGGGSVYKMIRLNFLLIGKAAPQPFHGAFPPIRQLHCPFSWHQNLCRLLLPGQRPCR